VKILLVGNYRSDAQESMLRFTTMMQEGLDRGGISCETIEPEPFWGRMVAQTYSGAGKWLGYLDKYVHFPKQLRARAGSNAPEHSLLVHVCDHSNAIYVPALRKAGFKVLVTCHDLIAVRAGVESTGEYHFSATGRFLQRTILNSLGSAHGIACVSGSTLRDVQRLVQDQGRGLPETRVIWNGLNYPYRILDEKESAARIDRAGFSKLLVQPFIFHLGTSQPRKNRDTLIRVLAEAARKGWNGNLIFAGDALWPELISMVNDLQMEQKVFQVGVVPNELVEAFFNRAQAFIFPSRSEGFGWPVIEAQACGCPVVSSNAGPLPEILGNSALLHDPEDVAGFTGDLLRLSKAEERLKWKERGMKNAETFKADTMIQKYIEFYREMAAA